MINKEYLVELLEIKKKAVLRYCSDVVSIFKANSMEYNLILLIYLR